ncbi:hypothetical protein QBC98_007811 [Kitasatospora acidiphila]
MKVGEARELIGEAVVGAVRAGFAHDYEAMGYAQHPAPEPASRPAGTGRAMTRPGCRRYPRLWWSP